MDLGKSAFAVSRKRIAHTAVQCQASFTDHPLMLDAAMTAGIGYYDVKLNAYTLPPDMMKKLEHLNMDGLEAVDQWYAGLLNSGEFIVYASAARQKMSPQLPAKLSIPLLRGTVAILVIDVLGNRSLWTPSGGI